MKNIEIENWVCWTWTIWFGLNDYHVIACFPCTVNAWMRVLHPLFSYLYFCHKNSHLHSSFLFIFFSTWNYNLSATFSGGVRAIVASPAPDLNRFPRHVYLPDSILYFQIPLILMDDRTFSRSFSTFIFIFVFCNLTVDYSWCMHHHPLQCVFVVFLFIFAFWSYFFLARNSHDVFHLFRFSILDFLSEVMRFMNLIFHYSSFLFFL